MTTTIMPEPTTLPSIAELQQRAVILVMTLHSFGNHRKVSSSILNTEADKALLRVSKQLIDCPEGKACDNKVSEIRRYVVNAALPSPFKNGTYTIPIGKILDVDEQLRKHVDELDALKEALRPAYANILADSKRRLGPLFVARDYPTIEGLIKSYGVEWQYIQFGAPGQLSSVDSELLRREKLKLRDQWQDAMGEMRDALRVNLAELVNYMVERLTLKDDGKPKKFRASTITKFNEFFADFDAYNLTNDVALKQLVETARNVLEGVEPEDIKRNNVRQSVKQGFEQIQNALDDLGVEVKATRKYKLED